MSADEIAQAQDQIGRAIDRARAGDDKELAATVRDLGEQFTRLFVGSMRMLRIHDVRNRAFDQPMNDLAKLLDRLRDLLGLVQIVMVEEQIYINDVRLRLDARQDSADSLGTLWRKHDVGGVNFHDVIGVEEFRTLVQWVMAEPADAAQRQSLQAALQQSGLSAIELLPVFQFKLSGQEARKVNRDALDVYRHAASVVTDLWASVVQGRMPNPLPVRKLVTEFVDLDDDNRDDGIVRGLNNTRVPAHSRHATQVTALSVLIGRALGLPDVTLADLGVAACYHDAGYGTEEDGYPPPFERHGSAGARVLLAQRGFHEARVRRMMVCLEHHRRFDHPRGASLFARIIHVADDYDTLTRYRAEGPLFAPPDAIARMWAARGTHYETVIMQALVNRVGRFPPGSVLELTDGRWVLVTSGVRSRETFALPLTTVVRDFDGQRPGYPINLDLALEGKVRGVVQIDKPPRPLEDDGIEVPDGDDDDYEVEDQGDDDLG